MIDIHCHILPGIDDGPPDIMESIEMAQIAYDDGIRHIIATPHFSADHYTHRQRVRDKVDELQNQLHLHNIDVTIYAGHEVRLENADFIKEHTLSENYFYLGAACKFILLEQVWEGYCKETPEIVESFLKRGIRPIIPHPERHFFFRDHPQLLVNLIDQGCLTQVSVDSLLGKNSEEARSFSHWLIENDYMHVIATDAHNVRRKPNLSEGFRIVTEVAGEERADEIRWRLEQIIL
ncbi:MULTISPECIES: tyrosine-protein phosphatase [unclassified Paenibacillus]|uniref:tyrosine-protein phosphatase n=1 Tax=unclassified Paenibacillus TaxID=185978 RepID=UPI003639B141